MDDVNAATADRYRTFADWARDASPLYEEFAHGVAADAGVLSFLGTLPGPKRQPNLLFAAVKYLTGVLPDYGAFRAFVITHERAVRQLMLERSTQTNEPGRCAVLLPMLSSLAQPIALLEAGAAAGLCLLPDRYSYDYDGHRVGPEDARLDAVWVSIEARGVLPEVDARLPESTSAENAFVLARDGQPVAIADQHGRSVHWLGRT